MKKLLAILLAALLCLTCFVACADKEPEKPVDNSEPTAVVYDVEDATAYLKNMYKKYLVETETGADFTLVSQVMKSGVVYTVTWTTDRDDIKITEDAENKQVKVDINEKTTVEIKYTLTATVTDPDGKTATLKFELTIPKYVLSNWTQYMAAEAGKSVVIEGYVAAVHSQDKGNKYNQLYIHDKDNKGGYYIYSMTQDPVKDLNLKKGMLVSVTGTKDIYSGTHELKDAVVTVLDSTVTNFSPLDITKTFKEAEKLTDKALVDKLGMLVTIKGVEITGQDDGEKQKYYNFKLGDNETYIRLYRTDCPCSVSDADMEAIAKEHGEKRGYTADVTGVVVQYNGAIYLNPVDKNCFKYGKFIQKTDAEKIDYEYEILAGKIGSTLTEDTEFTIADLKATVYTDVKIENWASDAAEVKIEGGKIKITLPEGKKDVVITADFTCGETKATKEFKVTLNNGFITFEEIAKIAKDANADPNKKYNVTGIVKKITNTEYGNFYILNDLGQELYVYGMNQNGKKYGELEAAKQPKVGDMVVLNSVIITYNGTEQLKDAELISFQKPISISDAVTEGNKYDKGKYSTDKILITGTVDKIDSAEYGNMYIKDSKGNKILVYGLYSFDGVTRYDKMTVKPAVGDTVTILGVIGKYNEAQIKNGWLQGYVKAGQQQTFTPKTVSTADKEPVNITAAPVAGTEYVLYFKQTQKNQILYATGEMSGNFGASSETVAVTVYVEKSGDKYYLYIVDKNNAQTKKYITLEASGDYLNFKYVDSKPAEAFTLLEADGFAPVITLGETKAFIGTYGNYTTFNGSKYDLYFSTSYVAHLATLGTQSEKTDADKVATEKNGLTVESDEIFKDGEFELALTGKTYTDVAITWASDNTCAVIDGNKVTFTLQETEQTVKLTATLKLGDVTDTKVFTITVKAKGTAQGQVNLDFVTGFSTYASSWGSSYTNHEITFAQAGATGDGKVVLTSANKQNSGNAIDDRPVICSKAGAVQYVTVDLGTSTKKITSATFDLKQWSSSKVFEDIHIEYTTDGTTWTSCSNVITVPAALSTTTLPAGVTSVRLSFASASDKGNTQIGLTGITLVLA